MISEKQIRTALDAAYPDAEPSLALWERIRTAVPQARPARRPLSRLAVAAVWILAVLTGSVAVASTPQVQALIDKMFKKTGIELVEFTPEVKKEWESKTTSTGEPVVQAFVTIDPTKVRELAHPAFKLPAYLPAELTGPRSNVQSLQLRDMSAFIWSGATASGERRFVIASMHTYVFGKGSKEGTSGPVQDVRDDLKVGGLEASAFLDNQGWHIMWAMDNHQYIVIAGGYSLDEALKIAESMK